MWLKTYSHDCFDNAEYDFCGMLRKPHICVSNIAPKNAIDAFMKAAWEKLDAGADLLQVYTGMVYEGPGLIQSIKKELCDC